MYLVDTNVFLEALLEQEKTPIVKAFFEKVPLEDLFITDLALHSIGIILYKLEKPDLFNLFIEDMIFNGLNITSLTPHDLPDLKTISSDFGLDFDDSYQYMAAKYQDLQLISFDKDFDKTDIGRKEPQEITPLSP